MSQKKFSAMTKAEKRVAIAEDVLMQVGEGTLIPKHDIYVRPTTDGDGSCLCCALGGMMMAKCNLKGDRLPGFSGGLGASSVGNELKDVFSVEQLALIEAAFDLATIVAERVARQNDKPYVQGVVLDGAKSFWRKNHSKSAKAHLVAIMKNIIENRGTFVPESK